MLKREYVKELLRRAFSKTSNLLGWRKEKIVGGIIAIFAIVIGGGFSAGFNWVTSSLSFAIAVAIILPVIFLWNVIEAQADMYWDVSEAKAKENDAAGIRPKLQGGRRQTLRSGDYTL